MNLNVESGYITKELESSHKRNYTCMKTNQRHAYFTLQVNLQNEYQYYCNVHMRNSVRLEKKI